MWLARALSVGAILLLARFVKHAEASKVGSLFYREPATAIEAWLLFASRSDGAGSQASRWGAGDAAERDLGENGARRLGLPRGKHG